MVHKQSDTADIEHSYTHVFHVLDLRIDKLVLGIDYLHARQASMDYNTGTMWIHTNNGVRMTRFKMISAMSGHLEPNQTY
jgi:hypothetical protein